MDSPISSPRTLTNHHANYADTNTFSDNKSDSIKAILPEDFPLPSRHQEQWKFTPLRSIRHFYDEVHIADMLPLTYQIEEHEELSYGFSYHEITSQDKIHTVVDSHIPIISDRISALAFAHFSHGIRVEISADNTVKDPIYVRIKADSSGLHLGHLILEAHAHSQATIVIIYEGVGDIADNIDCHIHDHAQLTVIIVKSQDHEAKHVGSQYFQIAHQATLHHFLIQLGSAIDRVTPHVRFCGTQAQAYLWGMYCARSGENVEQHILVDHNFAQCSSRVFYKGALWGTGDPKATDAHAAWVGDIVIQPQAQGTNTYEINRNLLLNSGARADSVPNLEIYTNDIERAGHASAISKFDNEQLFYFLSRGIPAQDAKKLIVRGFFMEILTKLPVDSLREKLENYIEQELSKIGV